MFNDNIVNKIVSLSSAFCARQKRGNLDIIAFNTSYFWLSACKLINHK